MEAVECSKHSCPDAIILDLEMPGTWKTVLGEVADAAGVSALTIHFYERKGLLPKASRGANGYREYDTSTLTRLQLIRSGQTAWLTLARARRSLKQSSRT